MIFAGVRSDWMTGWSNFTAAEWRLDAMGGSGQCVLSNFSWSGRAASVVASSNVGTARRSTKR